VTVAARAPNIIKRNADRRVRFVHRDLDAHLGKRVGLADQQAHALVTATN
jgi:hypothetical protein